MNGTNDQRETERSRRSRKLMEEGRRLYLDDLAKQLDRLGELLKEEREEEAPAEIYRILHTMKGSAPIFGFRQAGKVAEEWLPLWEWAAPDPDDPLPPNSPQKRSLPFLERLGLELAYHRQQLELGRLETSSPHPAPLSQGRLLVVDDDPFLRSYLARRLRLGGYEVDEAANVETATRLLRERAYDLITLDLIMEPQSGYELFHYLKADPTLKWIPLIVLSGRGELGDKVRCFELGADDYITKPFQFEEMAARLSRLLARTKSFEHLAFRDPLTGVYNRRYFESRLHQELRRLESEPGPLSLAFLDLDRFKSINDTYGHSTGDLILQGMAYLLQQNGGPGDLVARFGGEEFVVLFPGLGRKEAHERIEAVRRRVYGQPVYRDKEGRSHSVTFSAGIAEWKPGMGGGRLVRLADEAMYRAKETGRDRIIEAGDAENVTEAVVEAVRRRKRILIADDDELLRSIIRSELEELGADLIEARDGEEAFALLRDESPDLCILDGLMPRLDGFGLLARMKAELPVQAERTRILMLTGRSQEKDRAGGLRLGVHDYMTKPFSLVELELRVKRLLQLEEGPLSIRP